MPRYEYRCGHCGEHSVLRRTYDEWDEPIRSLCCGAQMHRVFVPTSNIFVPTHFHYTWSDFHDVSERELAHLKDEDGNHIELEHAGAAVSRSGGPSRAKKQPKREAADADR